MKSIQAPEVHPYLTATWSSKRERWQVRAFCGPHILGRDLTAAQAEYVSQLWLLEGCPLCRAEQARRVADLVAKEREFRSGEMTPAEFADHYGNAWEVPQDQALLCSLHGEFRAACEACDDAEALRRERRA